MCNINNLALQWGWGGFYILNLFAFMATEKSDMIRSNNPIGDDNYKIITEICSKHTNIVLSWGEEKPKLVATQATEIKKILKKLNKNILCLAENKTSGYQHPCIIKVENFRQPKKINI